MARTLPRRHRPITQYFYKLIEKAGEKKYEQRTFTKGYRHI